MTKKMINNIIFISLLIISLLFISLSKVCAVLLIVGFGFLTVTLGYLTVLLFISYNKVKQEYKQSEIEIILNSSDNEINDEEIIQHRRRNKQHNDKIFYLLLSVMATILCIYMFIKLLVI